VENRFGLDLVETQDPQPSGLLVVAHVDPYGSFTRTTMHAPGLSAGDVILEANGIQGKAANLRDAVNQVATNGGQLDVRVQPRPPSFVVTLVREGALWKKLGLSIEIDRESVEARIRVLAVRDEGLVPKWNELHGCLRVCPKDWITQVNHLSKNSREMFKLIEQSTEGQILELRIETPSRDVLRQGLNINPPSF
jgi:hypothetical protein